LFFDSTKLKNMPEKDDTWHGAMVWPQQSVEIFWEGSANVVVHALRKPNHHKRKFWWFREGNHQVWWGMQSSFLVCPWVFFYDQHTPYNALC
jgi:hypothetical protein